MHGLPGILRRWRCGSGTRSRAGAQPRRRARMSSPTCVPHPNRVAAARHLADSSATLAESFGHGEQIQRFTVSGNPEVFGLAVAPVRRGRSRHRRPSRRNVHQGSCARCLRPSRKTPIHRSIRLRLQLEPSGTQWRPARSTQRSIWRSALGLRARRRLHEDVMRLP